jgi:hypothetical protein
LPPIVNKFIVFISIDHQLIRSSKDCVVLLADHLIEDKRSLLLEDHKKAAAEPG